MFTDRDEAGVLLSHRILAADVICAIPRGGLPVAAPIAERLGVALSIIAVKKVVSPAEPEFARGAAGAQLVDTDPNTPQVWIDSARDRARKLEERFGTADLEGKHAVIVDDGVATGRTILLAIDIARHRGATRVSVAVPVASIDAARAIERKADASIILERPARFMAVGQFYEVFDQTSDDEVERLLAAHEDKHS